MVQCVYVCAAWGRDGAGGEVSVPRGVEGQGGWLYNTSQQMGDTEKASPPSPTERKAEEGQNKKVTEQMVIRQHNKAGG